MIIYTLPRLKENFKQVVSFSSDKPLTNKLRVAGLLKSASNEVAELFSQGYLLRFSFSQRLPCLGSKIVLEISENQARAWLKNSDHVVNTIFSIDVVCEAQSHTDLGISSFLRNNQWDQFLSGVNSFFNSKNFEHIGTPYLVDSPGMEPTLEPFSVFLENSSDIDMKDLKKYLPTSPELHLKKALCRGFTDIYEIKTCFRGNENSHQHLPEFYMLEWYRAYAGLELIEKDMRELVEELIGEPVLFYKTTMAELFKKNLDFDLSPQTSYNDLLKKCEFLNISLIKDPSWDDLFHILFLQEIEPHLLSPTFIYDFPPSQCALANINSRGWAERFEFYWKGFEIANAFDELRDPLEQRRRFEKDQKKREESGLSSLSIDENFMQEMSQNKLPPSGGIALGLERLYMALFEIKMIQQVKLWS